MSKDKLILLDVYKKKILKSISHLEYSFKKVSSVSTVDIDDEESLEVWESFASRLSRSVDLFLTKYLKLKVQLDNPGFDGSLRDYCNLGEKMNLLDNAEAWLELKEIRNSAVHEYEGTALVEFYTKIRATAKRVLDLKDRL